MQEHKKWLPDLLHEIASTLWIIAWFYTNVLLFQAFSILLECNKISFNSGYGNLESYWRGSGWAWYLKELCVFFLGVRCIYVLSYKGVVFFKKIFTIAPPALQLFSFKGFLCQMSNFRKIQWSSCPSYLWRDFQMKILCTRAQSCVVTLPPLCGLLDRHGPTTYW